MEFKCNKRNFIKILINDIARKAAVIKFAFQYHIQVIFAIGKSKIKGQLWVVQDLELREDLLRNGLLFVTSVLV